LPKFRFLVWKYIIWQPCIALHWPPSLSGKKENYENAKKQFYDIKLLHANKFRKHCLILSRKRTKTQKNFTSFSRLFLPRSIIMTFGTKKYYTKTENENTSCVWNLKQCLFQFTVFFFDVPFLFFPVKCHFLIPWCDTLLKTMSRVPWAPICAGGEDATRPRSTILTIFVIRLQALNFSAYGKVRA
jgi:hypothetical protein